MESVNKRVILIAIIMAVLATGLIYVFLTKMSTGPSGSNGINVYVASKTLPAKHLIGEGDLKVVKISKDNLNSKAMINKNDIIGKRLKDSVIEGEQILRDRIVDINKASLSYTVPAGKRAVSVNVNEQVQVANHIKPGDYIDIVGSFDREELEDKGIKTVIPRVSKTILQNIQILAVGQEANADNAKKGELPKTVTLAVSPEDAEKLVYATEYGAIRMLLRGPDDAQIMVPKGVVRSEIAVKN